MAVHVDDMKAPFGRLIMCHMVAETDRELRDMAAKIGVNQRWHQGDHFDICQSKRALAIKHGAVEITQRQLGVMMLLKRRTGRLVTPDEADDWRRKCLDKDDF